MEPVKKTMKILTREEMKNVNGGVKALSFNTICYTSSGSYLSSDLPGPAAIQCGQTYGSGCYSCERIF